MLMLAGIIICDWNECQISVLCFIAFLSFFEPYLLKIDFSRLGIKMSSVTILEDSKLNALIGSYLVKELWA